jgi:hypothetical protein
VQREEARERKREQEKEEGMRDDAKKERGGARRNAKTQTMNGGRGIIQTANEHTTNGGKRATGKKER